MLPSVLPFRQTPYRGRFAPSPTGKLHLGSLACAMASFLDARAHDGTWLIRIEDVDQERCRDAYTRSILKTLSEFNLVSDEPLFDNPIVTSFTKKPLKRSKRRILSTAVPAREKRLRKKKSAWHSLTGFTRAPVATAPTANRFVPGVFAPKAGPFPLSIDCAAL